MWIAVEAVSVACVALLPGDPSYSDSGNGSLGQAVLVRALVALVVGLGSRVAWWLAIFLDSLGIAFDVTVAWLEFGASQSSSPYSRHLHYG